MIDAQVRAGFERSKTLTQPSEIQATQEQLGQIHQKYVVEPAQAAQEIVPKLLGQTYDYWAKQASSVPYKTRPIEPRMQSAVDYLTDVVEANLKGASEESINDALNAANARNVTKARTATPMKNPTKEKIDTYIQDYLSKTKQGYIEADRTTRGRR
jgi:hypothetical protein